MISFIFHYYQNYYSGLPHTTSNINHYIKQEINFFKNKNTFLQSQYTDEKHILRYHAVLATKQLDLSKQNLIQLS